MKVLPKDLVVQSASPALESSTADSTPPITFNRVSDIDATCAWKNIELWTICTPRHSTDAFITNYDDTTASLDDVSDEEGRRTQKRIISYATTQFSRQHRIFSFSTLICGSHARFIRWDRAGAIVSRHFDYHQHPALLAEFLWRFGQLSRTQRGYDPTAILATIAERDLLRTTIMAHVADPSKRHISKMQDTLDPTFPCHKIACVASDGSTCELITQRPISSYTVTSPIGRSTRGYFALDTGSGELVFMKDYWRPLDSARPLESAVYATLQDAHVPHLPVVRLAGDVQISDECNQATLTQQWRTAEGVCAPNGVRGHRHHRVVQDVAYPLETAGSSRELVQAIRNAVQCTYSSSLFQLLCSNSCLRCTFCS